MATIIYMGPYGFSETHVTWVRTVAKENEHRLQEKSDGRIVTGKGLVRVHGEHNGNADQVGGLPFTAESTFFRFALEGDTGV